ncbi:toxin-antitoxin system HicB family antitoxin, partial [Pseudomonas putida]|uniref:toxin-antitoxin system HicB family antitoxin n=1 Tax=Pseudomonas putida TaxID=303 RepID=UPI002D1F97B2
GKPAPTDSAVSTTAAQDRWEPACRRWGRVPQKAYSGKLSLRLEPALHASVAAKAELAQKSINQWVSDILDQAARN